MAKDGSDLAGQTKNKLSLRAIKPADAGTYKLIATNPAGTLEIEAALVVTAAAKVRRTSFWESCIYRSCYNSSAGSWC